MASHEIYSFQADYTWNVFMVAYLMENVLSKNAPSPHIHKNAWA